MIDDDLIMLLGADAVIGPDDRAGYERGYRYGAGRAAAVVRPRDVAAVQELIRYARAHERAVLVQGAHSGLVGAATPDATGTQIVLSTERLRHIAISAEDRLATVGAGVRLSALNAAAAADQLTLPIDLGADPSLGGMVATNTGGARLMRYGPMRRQVVGIEAVLPDGTLFRDMRGLRKDNVGLDLKQMFIGNGITGAVITAVQVELQPLPQQRATMLAVPTSMAVVPTLVRRLEERLDHFLTACEGMSRASMAAAIDTHPALSNPFTTLPEYCLLVEASTPIPYGGEVDVEELLGIALAEFLEGAEPMLIDVLVGRGDGFWALRHSISDGLARIGNVIGLDVSVARGRLPALREAMLSCMASRFPALLCCDFGHVGDGGMHFNVVVPPAGRSVDPDIAQEVRCALYAIVVDRFEGSFSAEHGIGPANQSFARRFLPAGEQLLRERLNHAICA